MAKNKTAWKRIERKLREAEDGARDSGSDDGLTGQGASGERVISGEKQGVDDYSKIHFQKSAKWIEVIDFETCVSASYDWIWVIG